MNGFKNWRFIIVAFAALALLGSGVTFAQMQRGNVFGSVVDDQGSALPGVTVELSGIGATRVQVTDAQGTFRFPGLDPGNYKVTATLEGFSTVEYPSVNVRVSRSTTLELTLAAAVEEVITVTSESPLLDERRVAKGTTISQVELEKIPTARDPWAIITQTPGVLNDRINVGGNESGQQAVFTAPGTSDDENSFAVDGVLITDMSAIGASPTYYDFDQFEEMQVSTGGSDVEKVGAGAALNLVTKRGANTPRGSARFLLTDGQDELFGIFKPGTATLSGLADGSGNGLVSEQTGDETLGNTINEVLDMGFEAGGPIVRDRLWFWASYGRNDIKNITAVGAADNTLLENSAVKLNGQLAASNSAVFSWNRGDKLKDGRQAASFVTLDSSWDQTGPTELWKLEDTHVVSSSFYLSGFYSYVDGGFALATKGGTHPPPTTTDVNTAIEQGEGVWVSFEPGAGVQNGFYSGGNDRNTDNYQLDGSYFFNTGNSNHEMKFGASYRFFDTFNNFYFDGGRQVLNVPVFGEVWFGRWTPPGSQAPIETEYTALWLQDTITWGSLTINAGLRYDMQSGQNAPGSLVENPVMPNLLPALTFAGNDADGIDWNTLSPRLGATWALGPERKTLLRTSFARFAEQLSATEVSRVNPLSSATATFTWTDRNGNDHWDSGEEGDLVNWVGFNPDDPTSLSSPNVNAPGLDAPVTDEFIIGVEHAVLPEFVVGADFTWRRTSDDTEDVTLIDDNGTIRPARNTDYVYDHTVTSNGADIPHLPDGTPWSQDYYTLPFDRTGGNMRRNGDRDVDYTGFGINMTKRLSNQWMARGYFQYGKPEWSVGQSYVGTTGPNRNITGNQDGDIWFQQSAGSGAFQNVFIQSTWSWNLNGMYQVAPDRPWGFNIAANLFGREGYPIPYTYRSRVADGRLMENRVTAEGDSYRNENIFTTDLRLEKDMPFTDNLSGTFSIEVFNLFNDNYNMQRQRRLSDGAADFVTQTLSPRVYRLGFRLSWR